MDIPYITSGTWTGQSISDQDIALIRMGQEISDLQRISDIHLKFLIGMVIILVAILLSLYIMRRWK